MRIGFAYDLPLDHAGDPKVLDSVASEYEDEPTLSWIREELARHGDVVGLPWGREAAGRIIDGAVDVVFNITEGRAGRTRESLLPAVCEIAGVPYTGSDPLALGLALDKEYTKILARSAGIPTPNWLRVCDGRQLDAGLPGDLAFPVIVKPVTGGSSMGVHQFSRATDAAELRHAVEWVIHECEDDALVEQFIPGRELAAGVLDGEPELTVPHAELVFPEGGPDTFYSVEWKSRHQKVIRCPADLTADAAGAMHRYTREIRRLLGARDLGRADYRLSADGTPYFIEYNPLPGLSPYYSVFPAQVRAAGEEAGAIIDRLVSLAQARADHHITSPSMVAARGQLGA